MVAPTLIAAIDSSLTSAVDSLPTLTALQPPDDGISLLSVKNELLLAYLQNLVLLLLIKLRAVSPQSSSPSSLIISSESLRASSPIAAPPTSTTGDPVHDAVVQNLVTIRIYLEKGVRPLESRLKYQLDKLLLAVAEESASAHFATNGVTPLLLDHDNKINNDNDAPPAISALSYRPNPSSFLPPATARSHPATSASKLYRPPHITPTTLPQSSKNPPRPRKSATLDTFVREEMTDAPVPEMSIGAGNGLRGREAERERERRGYEEGRLVRLPEEKKKGGKRKRMEGEDWFGVGEFGDGQRSGGKREKGGKKGKRR